MLQRVQWQLLLTHHTYFHKTYYHVASCGIIISIITSADRGELLKGSKPLDGTNFELAMQLLLKDMTKSHESVHNTT
jgi:hypothetical protein